MTDPTPPPAGRRWVAPGLVALALAAGVFAYFRWRTTDPPAPPPTAALPDITQPEPGDEPDGPHVPINPGYLGPQACAPCHAERVAEFLPTPHARACRRPQDGPMPPGFDPGRGRFDSSDHAVRFDMTHTGAEYFQTATQSTPAGERRSTSRIDLVYGANKADEVFFTWRENQLFELMTVWLHPLNRWANTSYHRHGSGNFARATTTRCLECHTTWVAHVPGTLNEYRPHTGVFGVTCERCHGPGQQHVEFHKTHAREKVGRAVIHPGQLDRERQIEVCTQCHGNANKGRTAPYTYRPGEPLESSFRISTSRYPEEDHVANQVKYLRQSKCFQGSDTLTCASCHDPHRPHNPADKAASRASCLTCHAPEKCTDRPRLPVAVRDDCIGCHMPQRVWMNVHFHTEDDKYVPPIRRYQHRIAIDPVARSEVLLAWHRTQPGDASRTEADRLSTELAGHWLKEIEKCRGEYRFYAAIGAAREALRIDPPAPLREKTRAALQAVIDIQTRLDADLVDAFQAAAEQRYIAAIETLERVLKVKPDWAVAHARLGIFYARTRQLERATEHLEAVARHDPNDGSGLIVLGELADLGGRHDQAVEYYRRAEQIEPFDAPINYRWGLALLKLGRWAEAADRFRRVLVIDPRHAGGAQGLSHALREQGQAKEAVRQGRRAARLTEYRVPDVLVTLAEAYTAAGRAPEAAAAAVMALDADTAAQLDTDTRHRLEVIRARAGP